MDTRGPRAPRMADSMDSAASSVTVLASSGVLYAFALVQCACAAAARQVWRRRTSAECTWLSPPSYAASFPCCFATCFGVRLHARGCCGFGSAVRRSAALPVAVLDGPVGAAQQQLRNGAGFASSCGPVQRRGPARQTAAGTRPGALGRFAAAETAHPSSVWPFTAALNPTSNRTIRQLPWSAAQCSAVRPSLCTRGRGAGVGPHRGTPVPNRYPNTKQQARPERRLCFWVTVNDREYSERTRSTRHLAPRSRIHQTCQTSESRGNGDCGRRRRRDSARRQGSVQRVTELDVLTGTDERLHAASQIPIA
jgi:hypothetical protein